MESQLPMPPSTSSFRDPSGAVVFAGGRVIRWLSDPAAVVLDEFLATDLAKRLVSQRRLVPTRRLSASETAEAPRPPKGDSDQRVPPAAFEHEPVAFMSYPYEWEPTMLADAARLTLDLHEGLLASGRGLKDASAFNVAFEGPSPVFLDLASIERRSDREATWYAYGQFVRNFLLPLLVEPWHPFALAAAFQLRRDGLEPAEVYRGLSPLQRLLPPALTLVTVPARLERNGTRDAAAGRLVRSREQAAFVHTRILRGLRRKLDRLDRRAGRRSAWSGYQESDAAGPPALRQAKRAFVTSALEETRPRWVLDAGCNDGEFSLLAAANGARVVAIDREPAVVAETRRRAMHAKADVLPLVVDLARPSPAVGWRNGESRSFLDRARGRFDLVMALALGHHLIVRERLVLGDLLAQLGELSTRWVLFEFVSPTDDKFRQMAGKDVALYTDLTRERFERLAADRFRLGRAQELPGSHRTLYLLEKKP